MRVLVLGANGRTGRWVVQALLDRGGGVRAVMRRPAARWDIGHAPLDVVQGDPCSEGFLTGLCAGQDVLVSTLGPRRPTRAATEVCPRAAAAIVTAAQATGLRRVVVTSSALLFPSTAWQDRVLRGCVRPVVEAAQRMEHTLGAADLDVTVLRCGFLGQGRDSAYRLSPDALPPGGVSMSRRALAHALVDRALGAWTGHHVFGVAGPDRRQAADQAAAASGANRP